MQCSPRDGADTPVLAAACEGCWAGTHMSVGLYALTMLHVPHSHSLHGSVGNCLWDMKGKLIMRMYTMGWGLVAKGEKMAVPPR